MELSQYNRLGILCRNITQPLPLAMQPVSSESNALNHQGGSRITQQWDQNNLAIEYNYSFQKYDYTTSDSPFLQQHGNNTCFETFKKLISLF